MAETERNWKDWLLIGLVVLVVYLIWDSYYNDPLTRLAQLIDTGLDKTAGVFVDETGRVVAGGRNVLGGALVGTGKMIRSDDDDKYDDKQLITYG